MENIFHYDLETHAGEKCIVPFGNCEANCGRAPHFQSEKALNDFTLLVQKGLVKKNQKLSLLDQNFISVDDFYQKIPMGTMIKIDSKSSILQVFIGEKINDKFLRGYTLDGELIDINVTKIGDGEEFFYTIKEIYNSSIDLTRNFYGTHDATVIEKIYPVGTIIRGNLDNKIQSLKVSELSRVSQQTDKNEITCKNEDNQTIVIIDKIVYGLENGGSSFRILEIEQPPTIDSSIDELVNGFPEGSIISITKKVSNGGGIFKTARIEDELNTYQVTYNNGSWVTLMYVSGRDAGWSTNFSRKQFLSQNPKLVSFNYLQMGQAYPYNNNIIGYFNG